MKKLIFTSMLTAVGLFAQSNGTTPAAPQKKDATPAATAQTPAPTQHHRHKKGAKTTGTAATNATPAANSAKPAPAPAPSK